MLSKLAQEMRQVAEANLFDPVQHLLKSPGPVPDKFTCIVNVSEYKVKFSLTKVKLGDLFCWTFSFADVNGKKIPERLAEEWKQIFLREGRTIEQKSLVNPGITRIFAHITRE